MHFSRRSLFFFFLLVAGTLAAQDKDRLHASLAKLKTAHDDTNKVLLLNDIAWDTSYENLAAGISYAQQALALAEELKYERGTWKALNTLGATYTDMGDYEKALDAHIRGLKICERLNDKGMMASSYLNLSNIYTNQEDEKKSQENLWKALKLLQELGNKKGICATYMNLGASYFTLHKVDSAQIFFQKAHDLSIELKETSWEAHSLSGIGQCYQEKGDTARANVLLQRAIAMFDSLDDDYELSTAYYSYAGLLSTEKHYAEAEKFYMQSLELTRSIGFLEQEKDIWTDLAQLYEQSGQPARAYDALQKTMVLKDSLLNEKVLRHQRDLEAVYEDEKKENRIKLLQKEHTLQSTYLILLISGCVLLLLFLFVLYNRSQLRKRVNRQLGKQHDIIEEKNKNITDSISYARRIQEAVLPPEGILKKQFSDAFVFYRPRDIVSGDFWWCTENDGKILLAAADCTGHGVPGGFMSIMGAAFLAEIVNEKNVTRPDEVLNLLREKVIHALRQGSETEAAHDAKITSVKDGMDIVMLRFSPGNFHLELACANNPVWVMRNGEFKEISPDKFPVGIFHNELKPFRLREEQLQKGDMLYLFSDGYADQFGGPNGKKFKYRQLQEMLMAISARPCTDQHRVIAETFEKWKGMNDQVDDVLVVGVRI